MQFLSTGVDDILRQAFPVEAQHQFVAYRKTQCFHSIVMRSGLEKHALENELYYDLFRNL